MNHHHKNIFRVSIYEVESALVAGSVEDEQWSDLEVCWPCYNFSLDLAILVDTDLESRGGSYYQHFPLLDPYWKLLAGL